ncbi:hypothetical protein M9H77_24012 [Catharanthus roseus]|uniref:Uncharacterized protein n=1 Tax=Catharanthus roseus TaxID=4058 RepID=A0ACC0AUW4_CATRO|nr:hypothetical protein M9H77_24012 [Catharanthus roseus]
MYDGCPIPPLHVQWIQHCSERVSTWEDFYMKGLQIGTRGQITCLCHILPAICPLYEGIKIGSCGPLLAGPVCSQLSFFAFFLCVRFVGGRNFSGLFCCDSVILLITDMKLPVNHFPFPRAGLQLDDEA